MKHNKQRGYDGARNQRNSGGGVANMILIWITSVGCARQVWPTCFALSLRQFGMKDLANYIDSKFIMSLMLRFGVVRKLGFQIPLWGLVCGVCDGDAK